MGSWTREATSQASGAKRVGSAERPEGRSSRFARPPVALSLVGVVDEVDEQQVDRLEQPVAVGHLATAAPTRNDRRQQL
jgi:hypothetical protein